MAAEHTATSHRQKVCLLRQMTFVYWFCSSDYWMKGNFICRRALLRRGTALASWIIQKQRLAVLDCGAVVRGFFFGFDLSGYYDCKLLSYMHILVVQ